jgi:hypothetical protein
MTRITITMSMLTTRRSMMLKQHGQTLQDARVHGDDDDARGDDNDVDCIGGNDDDAGMMKMKMMSKEMRRINRKEERTGNRSRWLLGR